MGIGIERLKAIRKANRAIGTSNFTCIRIKSGYDKNHKSTFNSIEVKDVVRVIDYTDRMLKRILGCIATKQIIGNNVFRSSVMK